MIKNWLRCFTMIACLLVLVTGCGKSENARVYHVGVDPSWSMLELEGQELNVFAFSGELLQEISKVKRVRLARVNMSWDNLLDGLKRKQVQAILSSIPPNLITEQCYNFSQLYLATGPVLIVPRKEPMMTIQDLNTIQATLSIQKTSAFLELLRNYPHVTPVFYDRTVLALDDLSKGNYAGVLAPLLPANKYVNDLYATSLQIASEPLNNEGLRLITLQGSNHELISLFNEGLEELKKSGKYQKLLNKWSLASPTLK